MLKEIQLQDVGPSPRLEVVFGSRLNLFTGDNGLGKTFLLDIAWWALTGTWAGDPALPQRGRRVKPQITYHTVGKAGPTKKPKLATATYDFDSLTWVRPRGRPTMPGLVIYARIDGGFSVWDPARNSWKDDHAGEVEAHERPRAYHFSLGTLFNGLGEDDRFLCNGLIRDWVNWQNRRMDDGEWTPFEVLERAVRALSPHPGEWMEPGAPTRVSIDDVRDIPTIELPYGTVPVTHASAAMKRIVGLAYLLVWAWYEHIRASRLRNRDTANRLILLMDEVELHLHPQWQRTIVPTLLTVAAVLEREIDTQLIGTTHAPLVLASVEPLFDEERDRLFTFSLAGQKRVTLEQIPWSKQGDAGDWLVSDAFGLEQARSKEAEIAIEAAEAFMRKDRNALPPSLDTKQQIHEALLRVLPGDDRFWPRWIVRTGEGLP